MRCNSRFTTSGWRNHEAAFYRNSLGASRFTPSPNSLSYPLVHRLRNAWLCPTGGAEEVLQCLNISYTGGARRSKLAGVANLHRSHRPSSFSRLMLCAESK